jgi:glycosyltransferase involved in cell wall biosynthesis
VAIHVVERPKRQPPALHAVSGIGNQAIVSEENVDVVAVNDRAGRSARVCRLVAFDSRPGGLSLPHHFAAVEVEADRKEPTFIPHLGASRIDTIASLDSGQIDAVTREDRRRVSLGQRCLPDDIRFWTDLAGQMASVDDAAAVRPAKARPVTGRNCGDNYNPQHQYTDKRHNNLQRLAHQDISTTDQERVGACGIEIFHVDALGARRSLSTTIPKGMPAQSQPSICLVVDGDRLPPLGNQTVRDFSVQLRTDDSTPLSPDADCILWLPNSDPLHAQTLEECIWALQSSAAVAWTDTCQLPNGGAIEACPRPLGIRREALERFDPNGVKYLPWACQNQLSREPGTADEEFFGLPQTTPQGWRRVLRNLRDAELLSWHSWTAHPGRSLLRLVPLSVKEAVNHRTGRELFDLSFYRRFEQRLQDEPSVFGWQVTYQTPPKNGRQRIALCCPNLGHGGAENIFLYFARQFDRARFELILLAAVSGDSRQLTAWNQVVDRIYDVGQLVSPDSVTDVICSMASNWQWDGFVLQNTLDGYRALATMKSTLPNMKSVDILHNIDERWDLHELTIPTANALDRRIVTSRSGRDKLVRLGVSAKSVHLIRTGIDLDRFQPCRNSGGSWRQRLAILSETRIILFAGHLIERKGPLTLVEIDQALQSVRDIRPYHFVVVGDGPERQALGKRIHATKAQSRFDFLGQVADTASLMAAADILVLPSQGEGTPLVISEALAAGTPVVSTRVGAIEEILPTTCGILVDPGASLASSFAAAITELLADDNLRNTMGAAGRSFVEQHHNSVTIGSQYQQLIEELLPDSAAG